MWLPDCTGHDDVSVLEPLNRQEAQRHHTIHTLLLLVNLFCILSVFFHDGSNDGE